MPNNLLPSWGDEYGDKVWEWICHGNSSCMLWHQEQVLGMTRYRENNRLEIQKTTSDQDVHRNESWLIWQVLEFKFLLCVYLDSSGTDFFFSYCLLGFPLFGWKQRYHKIKQFPGHFPTYLSYNHSEAFSPFDMIPYHRWGLARMSGIIL